MIFLSCTDKNGNETRRRALSHCHIVYIIRLFGFSEGVNIGLAIKAGGDFIDFFEDPAVAVGDSEAAARHYALGDIREFLHGYVGKACRRTSLAETGHEYPGEAGAVEIDSHAEYGGGVEHTVHADLCMVAYDGAAELELGAHEGVGMIIPYSYLGIVILQVGCIDSRADVAPFAYHGVAEIAVVRFVAESEQDGVVDFPADLAIRTEGASPVDLRPHPDLCFVAKREWSAQA